MKNKKIMFRTKNVYINGIKTKCIVPSSHPAYNYWYENLYKRIDNKLFEIKIHYGLQYIWWKEKRMRKLHCRYGRHKVRNHTYSWDGSDYKRKLTIRAIKCDYCNYMFFASKKDREKYQEQEKKSTERFSAFCKALSGGNRKIHTAGGAEQGELSDCSLSCDQKFEDVKPGKQKSPIRCKVKK